MNQLTVTLAISQEVRGGTEPAGTTITLRVDDAGFHDAGGLGRTGQAVDPLDVENVAELLRTEFESGAVRAVFKRLQELGERV